VINGLVSISRFNAYKVIDRKEGGMGRVYILEKLDKQLGSLESIYFRSRRMQDEFKFIYREFLAAKTVKSADLESQFLRELNIWISLKQPGIVPLLKVMREDDELLGIMPVYESNLREYLAKHPGSGAACLKSLHQCVQGLEDVSKFGIFHLDLKPENLLVTAAGNQLQIDVSDWGIANVKMEIARSTNCPEGQIGTIIGAGTIPYMSPERLKLAKPNSRSDVFSLGVIFYELLLGELPYHSRSSCESQIVSGQYMDRVNQMVSENRLPRFIVEMLHPNQRQRTACYKGILKFLAAFKG